MWISEKEDHNEEKHSQKSWEFCKFSFPKPMLSQHLLEWINQPKICEFWEQSIGKLPLNLIFISNLKASSIKGNEYCDFFNPVLMFILWIT